MAIKFNRSQTFATNGTVTAPGLHNLVDGLDIYQALITDQTNLTSVGTADELLIADADLTAADAPRAVTVQELFNDALTVGTYTDANFTANLTYGTATGNRTVSTNASITTGTINNATLGTTTGTAATFTSSTLGTTTATAANITNGTIQTLTSSTATITGGTFSGSINATAGTIGTLNSTTGTIGNFTTTLTGDVTISTGSATVGTRVSVVDAAQEYSRTHNFDATTLTSATSIAWDLSQNQVARLALATNGTIADPSNKVDGATYILSVTQSTGTNTLAWNASFKWPGGTAPTLTAGSGKTDIFTFISNGTSLFGVASQNYS
jgi:hypothetical protein